MSYLFIQCYYAGYIHSYQKESNKLKSVKSCLNGYTKWWSPTGTKLGCLRFITQIHDLQLVVPIVKFVDDSTASEVINQSTKALIKKSIMPLQSIMQKVANDVSSWAKSNNMQANPTKTKELFVCFCKWPKLPPQIMMDGEGIQNTDNIKLLGIHFMTDLKWQKEIDEIYSKAARSIYAVIIHTKAGLSKQDILEVYCVKIRPRMEFPCQVWDPGLTKEQSDSLETIQKGVLKIVYKDTNYEEALNSAHLPKLSECREKSCSEQRR